MNTTHERRRLRLALSLIVTLSPLLLLLLVLSPATVAQAGGVVTNCTEADLDAALVVGGSITFDCGGVHAPATILLSSAASIFTDTTVDGANGGHTITLDGQGKTRDFYVSPSAHLTATNLILTDGASVNGSCVYTDGALELDNVEAQHCLAGPGNYGGALYVNTTGSVRLSNSNLHDNSAGVSGGAIYSFGALTVTNSYFAHNSAATNDGGGIWGIGSTRVDGSTFFSNTTASGWGGALYNQGTLSVTNSTLTDNQTAQGGGGIQTYAGSTSLQNVTLSGNHARLGGGLYNGQGFLTVTNSTLSGNLASGSGGAIHIASAVQTYIDNSALNGNMAGLYGGGIFDNSPSLTINRSTLARNSAIVGGGLVVYDHVHVLLSDTTFSGNSASNGGGGIDLEHLALADVFTSTLSGNSGNIGGGILNHGTLHLNNSTLSGNSAADGGGVLNATSATAHLVNSTLSGNSANLGGGLYNYGLTSLLNTTVSNNGATLGGALYMNGSATTVLTNTILAYSPTGGNCSGTVTLSSYSISSDDTCALSGTIHLGKQPNGLDPLLTGLGNYGGSTRVQMLKLGSPAIDGVDGNVTLALDQRGELRPAGSGFDIGAVERQLNDSDLAPWLYLPLLRR